MDSTVSTTGTSSPMVPASGAVRGSGRESPCRVRFRHRVPWVVLFATLCGGLRAATAVALPESVAGRFADAAPGTLIGKLEAAAAEPDLPVGLQLTRAVRAGRSAGAVLVETQVGNRGELTTEATALPVLSLSFRLGQAPEDRAYELLGYRTDQWYGSTFWSGPDWTRVGKDWHHPGENTPSVRRFVVPRDGRVRISGRVRKLHLDGDGVRVLILHGDRQVWQAELEGKDGTGLEPGLVLDVRRGEALRFVVHKRGAIYCDTTYWDPLVTYEDGGAFQASAAFGPKQGAGGWFYESCGPEVPAVVPPVLYVLGRDLLPRRSAVGTERPAQADERACLPCAVLADGDDASGVALALDTASGWRAEVAMTDALTCRLTLWTEGAPLPAGTSSRLPAVVVIPYEGHWSSGSVRLAAAVAESAVDGPSVLWPALRAAAEAVTADMTWPPEPALLLMVCAEWCQEDRLGADPEAYGKAARQHLARADGVLQRLAPEVQAGFRARLAALAGRLAAADSVPAAGRELYLGCRLLKRDVALADAALADQPLLFCKRRPPNYSHLVMQYYGWRQQPGGGLQVLEAPGVSLRTREITAGKLPGGSFLEPRLSYDAKQVVFSYVTVPDVPISPASLPVNEEGPDEAYFHVYTMGVDSTGLRQVTRGVYDDVMPTWLPDGGIAFCSSRRRAYSRCFGTQFSRRWDSYTLHRVEADGSGLRQLSWNDVSEWFPEVANSGHVLFARWDYIDRDAVTHQNLWAMRPDGTNQMAIWGNATPSPHCSFQAKAIPGSGKLAFIASAHHSVTGGPLCLLDPAVDSNSSLGAVTRLTPQRFPEAEGRIDEYYNSPWPLSERLFLVAYSPVPLVFEPKPQPDTALGLYLLDADGNRELLYRDPLIGSTSPVPLRPRAVPPVLPSVLPDGVEPVAEVVLADVRRGLGAVPRGTVREVRVIQILPKTTPVANSPPVGFAGEENTRVVLGTVPVEADGSARFLVPSGKALLFQALDERGCAYQTMRSTTAFQPGEKTSCIGCHENRMSVPVVARPAAQAKPAAALKSGPLDGRPFSYMTVVQPIWDRHCLSCHGSQEPRKGIDLTAEPRNGFAESYWSLCGDPQAFWGAKTNPENAAAALVPRFGARNRVEVTPPGGLYGARGSRLLKLLRAGHQKVTLTEDELRRIAVWIDCNAVFYGSYRPEVQAEELAGKAPPLPEVE